MSKKKLAQQANKAEKQVLIAAVEPATRVKKCEVCRGVYRHADTFQRHRSSGACEKWQQKAAEAQSRQSKRRPAAKLVQERRKEHKAADAASVAESGVRRFVFDSSGDGGAIVMSGDAGTVVAKAVLPERKRLAGFVLLGYTVAGVEDSGMAIAVWTAQVLMDLLTESSEERSITVTFSKPPCPMPLRGYARKRPCKETGHKITDQQRHCLASFCDAHEVKHSQPRASTVFEAMKSNFGDLTMDPATQRPILLDGALLSSG